MHFSLSPAIHSLEHLCARRSEREQEEEENAPNPQLISGKITFSLVEPSITAAVLWDSHISR